MKQAQAEMAARNAEPWRLRLEQSRGKIGDDGMERITTQAVFEIRQRSRSASSAMPVMLETSMDLAWLIDACGS
jgi:hypothetical protein